MDLTDEPNDARRLAPIPESLRRQMDKRQYANCLPDLEELGKKGGVTAAIALAHIYFFGGGGVRKDYQLARHWLEVIDDFAYFAYATHWLGVIHYKGLGVASDHKLAYQYFRRGGLRDDPRSLLMAGWMLKTGDGVAMKAKSGQAIVLGCVKNKKLNVARRMLAIAIAVGLI